MNPESAYSPPKKKENPIQTCFDLYLKKNFFREKREEAEQFKR